MLAGSLPLRMATPESTDALLPTGAGRLPVQPEQLLAALPTGVLVLGVDGTITYLNPAAAVLWGLPVSAVVGQLPAHVLPAVLPPPLVQALDQQQPEPSDYWLPHTQQWICLRAAPTPDGQRWVFWDNVTIRKQAEQELLQLQAERAQHETDNYHVLLNATTQGFCLLQLLFDETKRHAVDFRYLELNAAFGQHAGLPADALGRTVRELVPDLEPRWLETYGRVALTGQAEHLEYPVAQLGRWYDAHAFRMGPPDARQVGVLFSDVTERKHQEQRQAFLLKFSDALRAEPTADAVAYRALHLLSEQLGLDRCYIAEYRLADDRADFTHQVGNDRVPPLPASARLSDFPEGLRVTFDRTLVIDDCDRTEGLSDTDRQNIGALGLRAMVAATLRQGANTPHWVIVAVSAVPRHWRPGEVALLEEATERTWAAMERAKAEAALRASEERLQAINQQLTRTNVDLDNFIYTASHDLKAPITNIEGLLQVLMEDVPAVQQLPAEWPRVLALMADSVERFKRTLEQLSDVVKLQQAHDPPRTLVPVGPVVEDVRRDMQFLIAGTGAQVEVDVAGCPSVRFAEKNLRSVVYNLLSNALKYRHPDRPAHVRISCRLDEHGPVLTVQDNGLGISPEQQQQVFTMFRRLHSHVEGSGLGLYMVKRMVENADGRVELRSQLGLGSTFSVIFHP